MCIINRWRSEKKNNNDAYARVKPTPRNASARDVKCVARQPGTNAARLFIPETRVQTDKNAPVDFFYCSEETLLEKRESLRRVSVTESRKVPTISSLEREGTCSTFIELFSHTMNFLLITIYVL